MGKSVTKGHRTSQRVAADERPEPHPPSAPSVTPRQQRALQALLTGATDAEAGQIAKVSRETVCRWRRGDADFAAALNEARLSAFEGLKDAIRSLVPEAIGALREALADEGQRLKAAEMVLKHAAEPYGPTDPQVIRDRWEREKAQQAHERTMTELLTPFSMS